MSGDDPNLPMGGHAGYGPSEKDFPNEEAFRKAQKAAVLERYTESGELPRIAECGCCGAFHPEGFLGDCRQDLFRIDDPDALFGDDWVSVEMDDDPDDPMVTCPHCGGDGGFGDKGVCGYCEGEGMILRENLGAVLDTMLSLGQERRDQ